LPFGPPSTVRGPIEMFDTLIGPTTGPWPYGINISMLDGDIVPSTRSKSTSAISTRKESSSGPALALPSASHASPPSKLQPRGISLGDSLCSASALVQHTKAIRNRINGRKMANLVCARQRSILDTLYLDVSALAKMAAIPPGRQLKSALMSSRPQPRHVCARSRKRFRLCRGRASAAGGASGPPRNIPFHIIWFC
jgi:hypothetical protein